MQTNIFKNPPPKSMTEVEKSLIRIHNYHSNIHCPFDRNQVADQCVAFLRDEYKKNNNLDAGLLLAKLASQTIYANDNSMKRFNVDFPEAKEILNNINKQAYQIVKCQEILQSIVDIEKENLNNTQHDLDGYSDEEGCLFGNSQ